VPAEIRTEHFPEFKSVVDMLKNLIIMYTLLRKHYIEMKIREMTDITHLIMLLNC
jgi:hypothetical protein